MSMRTAYTYGDVSHFYFGRQHVYLVNNPAIYRGYINQKLQEF